MSSKKLLKRDGRGGRRENAGRKSNWKNKDTVTIRVPRAIVFQVIEVAHKIDEGEDIELNTEAEEYDFEMKSKTGSNEIATHSNKEGQKLEPDFVTKSIISYIQAIEIGKQILNSKKSARVSVAKIISEIYKQTLSPDDLKS
ncbi:MAG: hypothetical protein PUP92_09090 [Rhizonema sp. PD38]|nr:hypothetical protein [Rhizonema sp. PD38]